MLGSARFSPAPPRLRGRRRFKRPWRAPPACWQCMRLGSMQTLDGDPTASTAVPVTTMVAWPCFSATEKRGLTVARRRIDGAGWRARLDALQGRGGPGRRLRPRGRTRPVTGTTEAWPRGGVAPGGRSRRTRRRRTWGDGAKWRAAQGRSRWVDEGAARRGCAGAVGSPACNAAVTATDGRTGVGDEQQPAPSGQPRTGAMSR
jgi:hypothetical protein